MPPKKLEEQINDWCKHYRGPSRFDTCKVGVNYAQLADDSRPGMFNRLPCLRTHIKEDVVAECDLRQWHTPEEIAERVQELAGAAIRYMTARAAIFDYLKAEGKPTRNVAGSLPCPVCNKGRLGFSIAYNGHCHGTCSTQGCVSWME